MLVNLPSSLGTKTASSSFPSGNFLCFSIILFFNWCGDGNLVSFLSTGWVNNKSPNTSCIILAISRCCCNEHLSSIDNITGYLHKYQCLGPIFANRIIWFVATARLWSPWKYQRYDVTYPLSQTVPLIAETRLDSKQIYVFLINLIGNDVPGILVFNFIEIAFYNVSVFVYILLKTARNQTDNYYSFPFT